MFNSALDVVGKELGLNDQNKSDGTKSDIGHQLMMLNKNRALIGSMRRQNMVNMKSGRASRKKQCHENVEKKPVIIKKQDTTRAIEKANMEQSKIFIIDKNDPLLLEVAENETSSRACCDGSETTNIHLKECKDSQSDFLFDMETSSQCSFSSNTSSESIDGKILTQCNLKPITFCVGNDLTVHNFITDVVIKEENEVKASEEQSSKSEKKNSNSIQIIEGQNEVKVSEKQIIKSKNENDDTLKITNNLRDESFKDAHDVDIEDDFLLECFLEKNDKNDNFGKGEESGTSQYSIKNSKINLALKLTMANISNLNNDMKSESNHSSDNEFY
ncbi:hypothetical protein NQ314_021345 [Rhamnusium bicolor]|uniref:Uncharacterized protein n=1 Tax=Rhamnusium bicolor TaxID=1586634 RepID=A0AAV8WHQ1_9CUCU|nr:hypothetical protein NQ314_021345 [Rhamnusium bicolor]